MNKFLLLIIISISQLFADLIHPPDQASLNYIHVKFRWGSELGINEFQFQLTNENNVLLIDSLVTDTILIIRDKIVELCGDLPRIELFARTTAEGWSSWGNEV